MYILERNTLYNNTSYYYVPITRCNLRLSILYICNLTVEVYWQIYTRYNTPTELFLCLKCRKSIRNKNNRYLINVEIAKIILKNINLEEITYSI